MNAPTSNHSRNVCFQTSPSRYESSTHQLGFTSEKQQNLAQKKKSQRAEKMAKPFCFSRALVKRPLLILLCAIGLVLVLIAFLMSMGLFRYNTGNDRQFLIWGSDVTSKMDMRRLAHQEMHSFLFPHSSEPDSSEYKLWRVKYRADEGLLRPSILSRIVSFENSISTRPDFQTFCVKNSTDFANICDEQPFAPTFLSTYFKNLEISTQASIDTGMLGYAQSDILKSFFGRDLTTTTLSTCYGRSYVTFAGPVQGNQSVYDRPEEQEVQFVNFLRSIQAFARESSDEQLQILIASLPLLNDETIAASNDDLLLATAAFLVVFVYATVHVRSIILAFYSMIQTLMAFPIAYFLYRVIFQISFYNTLNNASIFIIFGVAADDLFIFSDAWKQTAKTNDSLDKRIALTYRRASKAMFVTSFTTAAAFLYTGLSGIAPISSFGYFTSILIVSNYCLTITMFPAMIVILQRSCLKKIVYANMCSAFFCCCCRYAKKKQQQEQELETSIQNVRPSSISPTPSNDSKSEEEKLGCIESFCSNKFNKFVKKTSILLIILLLSWLGVATYFTLIIQPLSKQGSWLSDSNRVQRAYNLQRKEFPKTADDSHVKVSLFWGVDGLDRSQLSRWDDSNLGELVWDSSFSVSSPLAQQFIMTLCEGLRRDEGNVLGADNERGGGVVSCFMEGFRDWLVANGKSFPMENAFQFHQEMLAFSRDPASLTYRKEGAFGFSNGKLRYIQIDALTPIEIGAAFSIKQAAIGYWENAIVQINNRASRTIGARGLSRGKMTGGLGFALIKAESTFVSWIFGAILVLGIMQRVLMKIGALLTAFFLLLLFGFLVYYVCWIKEDSVEEEDEECQSE